MRSPGPSPVEIQSHLYISLLQASAYDVTIRVTGTWKAIYKLHRVVLIQSGFFRSLFTAGFSESSIRHGNGPNDEITIIFDDYNITRSAFELCISRLYGGGPHLHVSPSLIPTIAHPLTPPYSGITEVDEVPPGDHPATPKFLLSLLATAIYLSIPAIAAQALSLVLKTIGPSTVLQYLKFACGKPVLTYFADDYTQAAVGLEHLAEMLDDVEAPPIPITRYQTLKATATLIPKNETPVTLLSALNTSRSNELLHGGFDDLGEDGLSYHYGMVSNKIGEACSCWLARWATDIFQYEDMDDNAQHLEHNNSRSRSDSLLHMIEARKSASASLRPVIWDRGGLDANWVSALISADTLFVKNERGRYNLARSVVELRRRGGILDDEENIWTQMFERGIYYTNMTFEDIFFISQDVSPTTKRPYVPLSTLQPSHWTQSVLRHQVTDRPTGGSGTPARDKELGITLATVEISYKFSELPRTDAENLKPYFPVLGDSSLTVGGSGADSPSMTGMPLSMDELFNNCHPPSAGTSLPSGKDKAAIAATDKLYASEANFFGLSTPRYVGATCVELDPTGKCRWSSYPPYRFSVEFWDVDLLKEKSRLHSHTIWYAGNLFNVYVQIVRKKSQAQLGIYLHRQSNVDPIPAASIPPLLSLTQGTKDGVLNSSLERSSHVRQTSLPSLVQQPTATQSTVHYSPSIHPSSRSSTPFTNVNHTRPDSPSSPSSPSAFNFNPSTLTPVTPSQPYRDPRSSISAYFAVSCASATGSSQTRFSSSPDVFSVGQSWGWKSSAIQTEEFVEIGTQFLPTTNVIRNREISLRATVLVGLI